MSELASVSFPSPARPYLHDFEELCYGGRVVWELLLQVGLHFRLAGEDGVLALLVALADQDGVKVLVQLLELQLALTDLVEGDAEQAVLVELPDVVKPWGGGDQEFSTTVWALLHIHLSRKQF